VLVAAFGMISFLTNKDVVADDRAGPLVGPVMGASAVLLFFFCLLFIAIRIPKERQRIWLGGALGIGVGCYLIYAVIGALIVGIGDPFQALSFLGTQLIGPFAISVGIAGVLVALIYMLVIASRVGDKGRPRWPWERDDEE
jgi:NADH:ubiquinone oxidoreductase subunit 6 (subunit J)